MNHFEMKRRGRGMFIDLCLNKETSSIRSDMFLPVSLLTELHFEEANAYYKQGAPTAL